MKTIRGLTRGVLFASLLFGLSACRERVYWISGGIETMPVDCSNYPELDTVPSDTSELLRLFNEAIQTEDLNQIKRDSDRIYRLTEHLKQNLQPMLSNACYPVRYVWRVEKKYLKAGESIFPVVLGFAGVSLSPDSLRFKDFSDYVEMSFARDASILEVCVLSRSLQALVSVGASGGTPRFYYRGGVSR